MPSTCLLACTHTLAGEEPHPCTPGAAHTLPPFLWAAPQGGVMVWDVTSASVMARLEDVPQARELTRERRGGEGCAIQGLAWVLARPGVLAIVIAPALLVLWDTKGGAGGGVFVRRGSWCMRQMYA